MGMPWRGLTVQHSKTERSSRLAKQKNPQPPTHVSGWQLQTIRERIRQLASRGFGVALFVTVRCCRVLEHLDGIQPPLSTPFVHYLVVFHAHLCAVVGAEFVKGGVDAHLEHVGAEGAAEVVRNAEVDSGSLEGVFRDESQLNAWGKCRGQGRGRLECRVFGSR